MYVLMGVFALLTQAHIWELVGCLNLLRKQVYSKVSV